MKLPEALPDAVRCMKRSVLAILTLLALLSPASAVSAVGSLRFFERTQCASLQIPLSNKDWSWLRQKRALVLGVALPDYPPFEMTAGNTYFEGLTADVACYLGQSLHVSMNIRHFADRHAALQALARGEIDIVGSANAFEVAEGNTVLSLPYVEDHPAVFVRSGEQRALPANLAGQRIAMADDYLPHSQLIARYPQAVFVPYASRDLALAALAFGAVDAYLGDGVSSNYLINLSYFNYVRLDHFIDLRSGGFGFALQHGNDQLKRIIDSAISAIDDSLRDEILKRWSGGGAMLSTRKVELTANEQRWIERHPVVRFVVNDDLAPFAFFDTDETLSGMSAELLEVIHRRTGLQFQAVRTDSFASLIRSLFEGTADLTIAAPTTEREADLRFSKPFIFSSFVIVTRDVAQPPSSLSELRGKRVAVPVMAAERAVLSAYPDIEVIDTPSILESLAMVAIGEADATFATLHGARYYLQHLYGKRLRITNILDSEHGALAFAGRRADTELMSIIDKALLSIPADEISTVLNRWRPIAAFEGMTWRNYKTLIYQIAAAAFAIIVCALIWNLCIRLQIRERKRAELALSDQLKFLQALINGTPHAIYVRDRRGHMVTCNDNYLNTLSVSRKDVIGKTALQSGKHNLDEAQEFHDGYMRVMQQDEAFEVDRTLQVGNAHLFVYHWIQPFHDTAGQVQGVICGWVDISERRKLTEELRSAKQLADASSRAKTTFLATMSHEIRTPMSAVIGMLELALQRAANGEFDRPSIEVAYDSAKGMLELIGDILDVVRIESGHVSLSPRRANLRELVESVARAFDGLARQKNLVLRLDIDVTVGCDVLVDPVRFQQILSNLLGNAIKFTDAGEVRVCISGQYTVDERLHVLLRVEDTGIGINAEDLQRLFKPFSQADHGSSARGGTGLGLVISRSLCELMGGSLHISSSPGQGTQLEASLLFSTLEAVAAGAAQPVPLAKSVRTMKVLVVDDQPVNRALLVQQLAFIGHQGVAVEDGAIALERWRSEPFDIVITDCNMPVMSGYELTQQIRQDEVTDQKGACVVVGLTANAQPEEKAKCLTVGMNDCLFKPISLSMLSNLISQHQAPLANSSDLEIEGETCTDQSSIIERLRELTGGDSEAVNVLIHEALRSSEKDLAQLTILLANQDTFSLVEQAHRIEGSARIMGDHEVITCCEALGRAANAPIVVQAHVLNCAKLLEDAQAVLVQRLRKLSERHRPVSEPMPCAVTH